MYVYTVHTRADVPSSRLTVVWSKCIDFIGGVFAYGSPHACVTISRLPHVCGHWCKYVHETAL